MTAFGSFDDLQRKVMAIEGVKSSRFLSDWKPGTGYAINAGGEAIGIGVDSPEQKNYAAL